MMNILCCCLHRRHDSDDRIDQVNERTHLIPSPQEIAFSNSEVTPSPSAIDHQRVKDRMGSIVRSKESKMVNVNARLPFNLHNQPSSSNAFNPHLSSSSSQSASSSSRSQSHNDIRVPRPLAGIAQSNSHIQVHVGAPLSSLSSPVASTSRPPPFPKASQGNESRSSSTASRDTDEGSVLRQREQPILGLKLVRVPIPGSAEFAELSGRRGRKTKKISEESNDGEHLSVNAITPTAHDAPFDFDLHAGDVATPRPPRQQLVPHLASVSTQGSEFTSHNAQTEDAPPTPRIGPQVDMHSMSGGGTGGLAYPAALEISMSPISASSVGHLSESDEDQARRRKARKIKEAKAFAIRDDGPLTISWGD